MDLFSEIFSGYKTVVTHLYCIFMSYFFLQLQGRGDRQWQTRESLGVSQTDTQWAQSQVGQQCQKV